MTWTESKNECLKMKNEGLKIKANLPRITLIEQNKEIGTFPGVLITIKINNSLHRYVE